ncbi:MAG: carboxypeptidase regulatory-like domain-containing protein, partial [Bradyrhizobium sp.]|nr:carboxypeptidase regulatory-like domain-containing protein [Bradyrhizobium sp.]
MTFRRHSNACLTGAAIAAFAMAWGGPASAQQKEPSIKPDAIGGVVTGPHGPEAGVWVIAETSDLPTKYAKMVVTNDAGQFVIPQLPTAKYKIWARGYGLVDSDKQDATPGKTVDLKAKPAPNAAAAAEYYPGMYWYSMLKIPATSEFPGSDKSPTGMPASMDSQATWIDSIKNSCQSCHALGSDNIRHPHVKELGEFKNSEEMWERRVQSGQAMSNMALTLGRLGPQRAYKMFADWTDRIAAGELPFDKPERPKGVERNVVITSWEWGKRGMYLHDEVSTDKRNPTVNANGKIYGS